MAWWVTILAEDSKQILSEITITFYYYLFPFYLLIIAIMQYLEESMSDESDTGCCH